MFVELIAFLIISFLFKLTVKKSVTYKRSPKTSSIKSLISYSKVFIPFSIERNKFLLKCVKINFISYIKSTRSYKISI